MKDSAVFSLDLTDEEQQRLKAMLDHESDDFLELVQVVGLDPKSDFRFANLSNVNFGAADLRGFDFTGADLTGATGDPQWDGSTILTDADLNGSVFDNEQPPGPVFETVLPDSFVKQHWPDLIMWMDRLQANPERYREDAEKLLFVFLRSDDTLVRRTALRYLANYLPPDNILSLIREHVFAKGEKGLVIPAFDLLREYHKEQPQKVRKFAVELLSTIWAVEAAEFLVEQVKSERKALAALVEFMSRQPAPANRSRFIASLAAKFGPGSAFVVRDPLTGDVFDFGKSIEMGTIDLITRAIIRRKRDEAEELGPAIFTKAFPANSVTGIRRQVVKKLSEISMLGLRYNVPLRSGANIREDGDTVHFELVTFDDD